MTSTSFNRKLGAAVFTMLLYSGTSHAQGVAGAARESRAKQQSETSSRVFTNKDDAPGAIAPATPLPSSPQPAPSAAATARHEIPYDPYEGSAQRVIVNATLNGKIQARLAVDTGAPRTIISSSLARRLGLMS